MQPVVITVSCTVNASPSKVWKLWTTPEDIVNWNAASDDWHTTRATSDLRVGGIFTSRMEAKDGSFGFDFTGVFEELIPEQRLVYSLEDGRKVTITFAGAGEQTVITEAFEAETQNSIELQQGGWQAILNNFKKYAEQ